MRRISFGRTRANDIDMSAAPDHDKLVRPGKRSIIAEGDYIKPRTAINVT